MAESYPEVFILVTELAMKVSPEAAPLNKLPGCWEHKIEHDGITWWFAINGHKVPKEFKPPDSMGMDVPPFSAGIIRHGWIAGIVDAGGGGLIGTQEDEVVAVLRHALESEQAHA